MAASVAAEDGDTCETAPAHGGHLYELDVRAICHNLVATLTRLWANALRIDAGQ